jgi:hypothetical protein
MTRRPGRQSKYFTHVQPKLELITHWRRMGFPEYDIVGRLGVAKSSFAVYKTKYPDLMDALKEGKDDADRAVVDALFKRACGYDYGQDRQKEDGSEPDRDYLLAQEPLAGGVA